MSMVNAAGEPVHLSWPVQRGATGKLNVDVQDTSGNVLSQAGTVASYPVGYLAEHPAFGIPWPAFEPVPISGDEIAAAVEAQVPNSNITAVESSDGTSAGSRILELDVETP